MNLELEQLVQDLRAEGALDSAGKFSLDAAKAREKLAQRQQREAGLWLVKLIQGAHMWEANGLELRQERQFARAVFGLGANELDLRPWLARLHDIEMMADPLYGPLATAFQAALADGCSQVEITLPEGPLLLDSLGIKGNWKDLEPVNCLPLRFLYAQQKPWWNPLLHLRPPQRSAENFLAAQRKGGLALPRVDMDRFPISRQGALEKVVGLEPNAARMERVFLSSEPARELMFYPESARRRAAVEEVNGQVSWQNPAGPYQGMRQWRHDQGARLPLPTSLQVQPWLEHLQREGLQTPPPPSQEQALAVRGVVAWNADSHLPATILPVKYGIQLEGLPFTSLPPGVTIWLSSSRWRTDIHQKKVVHDETYRELCNWCSEQFDSMVSDAADLLRASESVRQSLSPLRLALANARVREGAALRNLPFPRR
ncbi:MAG: hypothetical protein J0I12_16595 [Candidatus Eremiobacteraeota bacterium]|nr:hypothetical protein [Candidatus Eremiobacteraeota bacterium]